MTCIICGVPGNPNFCVPHWGALSSKLRQRWWRETAYSQSPPNAELIEAAREDLKESRP